MSATRERMPCSPARHRAPSWLAGCPTLIVTARDYHIRTTGSLERRAPLRPPRWQDASSLRTRWIQRESGGARVAQRAPETIWSYRPSVRRCEVARGRCNGRSCTYSSGSETLVPFSPTHEPSVCTWRHYQTLKVTSVFNICRLGDAVVSGPRETRHRSLFCRSWSRRIPPCFTPTNLPFWEGRTGD